MVSGVMPSRSAAASTKGLKAEPDCRWPWTARLNSLFRKLCPLTIARTRPSRGSTATSAACGPLGLGSHFSMASARSLLQPEVEGGLDTQAAAVHVVLAVVGDELLLHVLDEMPLRAPEPGRCTRVGSGSLSALSRSSAVISPCMRISSSTVERRFRASVGLWIGS